MVDNYFDQAEGELEWIKEKFGELKPLPMEGWFEGSSKELMGAVWIQLIKLDSSPSSMAIFERNQIVKTLAHSAIYPCLSSSTITTPNSSILMELTFPEPESTLSDDLKNGISLEGLELINFVRELASGLFFAKETKKLYHGNLCPKWVFRSQGQYLLAGWFHDGKCKPDSKIETKKLGKSALIDEKEKLAESDQEHLYAEDVYSLGLLALQASGQNIGGGGGLGKIKVDSSNYSELTSSIIAAIGKKTHRDFSALVQRMLHPNPQARPKIEEILQSLDILVGIEYEIDSVDTSSFSESAFSLVKRKCSSLMYQSVGLYYNSSIRYSEVTQLNITTNTKSNNFFHDCIETHQKRIRELELSENLKDEKIQLEIANLHFSIGSSYNALGLYKESVCSFSKTLDMKRKICGRNTEMLDEIYLQLGKTYKKLGDFKTAYKYLETGFEIRKKHRGSQDYSLVQYYNVMAELIKETSKQEKKRTKKSLELLYEIQLASLNIRKQWVSPTSSEFAVNSFEVGLTLFMKEDGAKAKLKVLPYLQTAIDIWQTSEQKYASNISRALMMMGSVYRRLDGEHQKALKYYNQAYDIIYKYYGPLHFKIALPLHYIGELLCSELNRPKDALQYLENADELLMLEKKENDCTAALNTFYLATCYKKLGEDLKAISKFKVARVLLIQVFGKDHETTKKCLKQLKSLTRGEKLIDEEPFFC